MSMAEQVSSRRKARASVTASEQREPASRNNRRAQVAAAKARVTLNKRLKVGTPARIVELSREKPE